MAYVSVNKKGIVTAVSDRYVFGGHQSVKVDGVDVSNFGRDRLRDVPPKEMKVAVIANWNQECGISTYTKFLVEAMRKQVKEVKIFSEHGPGVGSGDDSVIPCWSRGNSMIECLNKIEEYNPDFILIQHEFGIFPKAPYLLQMLQRLEKFPYAVVLHSTYEHLDKTICTSAMRNIIVHTEIAKNVLKSLGNGNGVSVIPHGCVEFPDRRENWNIYQTKHAIVQFGFGFFYKGVDRAIDAVKTLKDKYPNLYDGPEDKIFYCYYCSENDHTRNIHREYCNNIFKKVESLGLQDNVVVIRKWNTDEEINNILRTAKLAIFPYLVNPGNVVYGASGALRVAFANGIPCLASESHLFDEIPGLPRPTDAESLAEEIHKVFSNWKYKDKIIKNQDDYVRENTWNITVGRYLGVMGAIRKSMAATSLA